MVTVVQLSTQRDAHFKWVDCAVYAFYPDRAVTKKIKGPASLRKCREHLYPESQG